MRFCLIVMCGVSAALYGCQDESEQTAVAPASMDMSRSIGADAGSDVGVVSNTPDLNVVDTDASVQMPIDSGDAGALERGWTRPDRNRGTVPQLAG